MNIHHLNLKKKRKSEIKTNGIFKRLRSGTTKKIINNIFKLYKCINNFKIYYLKIYFII